MAWYQDEAKMAYVATYKSQTAVDKELNEAARYGWVPQTSRSGNSFTVTYTRTTKAKAQADFERARTELLRLQSLLEEAESQVAASESLLRGKVEAARTEVSDPVKLEREVLVATKALVTKQQQLHNQRQATLAAFFAALEFQSTASQMGVTVSKLTSDPDVEIVRLQTQVDGEGTRLQQEQAFVQRQEQVVKAVGEWQKAIAERWQAQKKVEKSKTRLSQTWDSSRTNSGLLDAKYIARTQAVEKDQAHHSKWKQEVEKRERELVACLQERDALFASIRHEG